MNENFTKGEWSVYSHTDGADVVVDGGFGFIGIESVAIDLQYEEKGFGHWAENDSLHKDIPLREQIANAHLIAAAPKMYQMLDNLVDFLLQSQEYESNEKARTIEKLLKVARGETDE